MSDEQTGDRPQNDLANLDPSLEQLIAYRNVERADVIDYGEFFAEALERDLGHELIAALGMTYHADYARGISYASFEAFNVLFTIETGYAPIYRITMRPINQYTRVAYSSETGYGATTRCGRESLKMAIRHELHRAWEEIAAIRAAAAN